MATSMIHPFSFIFYCLPPTFLPSFISSIPSFFSPSSSFSFLSSSFLSFFVEIIFRPVGIITGWTGGFSLGGERLGLRSWGRCKLRPNLLGGERLTGGPLKGLLPTGLLQQQKSNQIKTLLMHYHLKLLDTHHIEFRPKPE